MTITLRSEQWLGGDDEVAMSHRVALRVTAADVGKPVIGIADTSSELNPCNNGFSQLINEIERGVRDAGGIPARFPVMSLGEDLMKPSAMLYRNLVSMEIEETVRANPIDGTVLLANCDKSVPAAIMAAASTDIPSIVMLGGARSAPIFRGRPLGSGTDLWHALDDRRAGTMPDEQWQELEHCLSCAGAGSCNTMGTASTMAIMSEVLGMSLPGSTGLPATGPAIRSYAYDSGRRAVEAVLSGTKPSDLITQSTLENAAVVLAAIGGSTNAVIHLAAIAGRLGLNASLRHLDELWSPIPLLADIEPCGTGLIGAFRHDGGVAALARELGRSFDASSRSASGRPWSSIIAEARPRTAMSSIRSATQPVSPAPALVAVFGSLAPQGAVLKVAAASQALLAHGGRAVVFDGYQQMRAQLDDPELDVDENDIIVVRGCGPIGVPGMPEWGMAPIPKKLVTAGVRDMLRISDGRMSGTSFGTVVLHVAPESAAGGPLALVRTGDRIQLDVAARRLDLEVPETELSTRDPVGMVEGRRHLRGWPRLYQEHVLQAPDGCDLDFLTGHDAASREFIEPVVGRS